MISQPLKPGDRTITPTGRADRIVQSPWLMPHHALIAFDDGALLWMPLAILNPEVAASPARQRRKKAA